MVAQKIRPGTVSIVTTDDQDQYDPNDDNFWKHTETQNGGSELTMVWRHNLRWTEDLMTTFLKRDFKGAAQKDINEAVETCGNKGLLRAAIEMLGAEYPSLADALDESLADALDESQELHHLLRSS
jgi:hypothetical protein